MQGGGGMSSGVNLAGVSSAGGRALCGGSRNSGGITRNVPSLTQASGATVSAGKANSHTQPGMRIVGPKALCAAFFFFHREAFP